MTQGNTATPTARERLRFETRTNHAQLDAVLGDLRPFSSIDRYRVYLAGMRELYVVFGPSCDRCADLSHLPRQQQELIAALDADLMSCGAGPHSDSNTEHTPQPTPSDPPTDAAAWGAAYVLEGSAMGAQMLVRVAREKLPPAATTQFLSALAGDGVSRFRAFCAAMEAADPEASEAVSAAERVFDHAIQWYRRRLAAMKAGPRPIEGVEIAT